MKSFNVSKIVLVLTLSLFLFISIGSAIGKDGKIPITTNSKAALENYLKGRELVEKLRFQESIQYFEKAIKEDPKFALAYLNLAPVQPTAKDFFETLDIAVSLADKVSEGEQLWIKGLQAGVGGDAMGQREYYTKMVKTYPQDERAFNLLGNHYFGFQEYELALKQYNKAIKINPEFSQPYNQMGYAYRFMGKYDEAEEAFKKYIELIPGDPNPHDSYAEFLLKTGRYDESIKHYKKALALNPDFIASHIGLASNLNYQGKHQEARAELKKFYKQAKNDGQRRAALFAMSVSCVDEGDLDMAMEMIQKQYTIAKENNDIPSMAGDLVVMGNLLMETGQCDDAKTKYKESYMLMKDSKLSQDVIDNAKRGYYYNISRAALRSNDVQFAKARTKQYEKMVLAINNPFQIKQLHELKGTIALIEKNYGKAVKELEKSNLQNPYNIYRIAQALEGQDKRNEAEKYYKLAANFNALNNMNHAFIREEANSTLAGW